MSDNLCGLCEQNQDQFFSQDDKHQYCHFCYIVCQNMLDQQPTRKVEDMMLKYCDCKDHDNLIEKFQSYLDKIYQGQQQLDVRLIIAFNRLFDKQFQIQEEDNEEDDDTLFSYSNESQDIKARSYFEYYLKQKDNQQYQQFCYQKERIKGSSIDINNIKTERLINSINILFPFKNVENVGNMYKQRLISENMVRSILTVSDIDSYIRQIKFNINTISKKNQKALFSLVSSYLEIFKICHLDYDLCQLGYINSSSFEENSVISRDWLRRTNQKNKFIQDKYFRTFKIISFIQMIMQKFIFSSNKVIFLYKDSLDVKILEIIRTLTQYQLLDEEQFNDLIELMLNRMPIYRQYEYNIVYGLNNNELKTSQVSNNNRSQNTDVAISQITKVIRQSNNIQQTLSIHQKKSHYISGHHKPDFNKYGNIKLDKEEKLKYQKNTYIQKMMENKINYFEVFIQYICLKMDSKLIQDLRNVHQQMMESQGQPNNRKLKEMMSLNNLIIYNQQLGENLMDVMFGYIFQVNKYYQMSMERFQEYSKILYLMFGEKDFYYRSLEPISQSELFQYLELSYGQSQNKYSILQDEQLINYRNSLTDLLIQTQKGYFIYQEIKFIEQLHNLVQDMFSYIENLYSCQEGQIYQIQQEIGELDIFNSIMEMLMIYKGYLEGYSDKRGLIATFRKLMEIQIKGNIIQSDMIFGNLQFIHGLFQLFQIDSVSVSKILFGKPALFELTRMCLEDVVDKKEQFSNIGDYYMVMVDLINNLKNYSVIQVGQDTDYQIEIQDIIVNIADDKDWLQVQQLEMFITNQMGKEEDLFYQRFLELFYLAVCKKFKNKIFELIYCRIKVEEFIGLIQKSRMIYKRHLMMNIYQQIYVCFKNYLMDNRRNYFLDDPQDEFKEDPFVDVDYNVQLEFLISEIKYLIEIESGKENTDQDSQEERLGQYDSVEEQIRSYKKNTIFVIIYKIICYMGFQHNNIQSRYQNQFIRNLKYNNVIEQLANFLIEKVEVIFDIYKLDIKLLDFQNSQMNEFQDMMESISQNSRKMSQMNIDPQQMYYQLKEKLMNADYLDRKKKIIKLIFHMNIIKLVCFKIQQLSGNIEDEIFQNQMQQYEAQDVIDMTEKHSISQKDRFNYLGRLEKTNKEYLNDENVELIKYVQQSYQLKKYQKFSSDVDRNVYIQIFRKNKISNTDKWEYFIEKFNENENYVLQFIGFFILQSQLTGQMSRQLECMLHVFYGSPKIIQKIFYIYIVENSPSFKHFVNSSQNFQDISSSAEIDEKVFNFIEEMDYENKQTDNDYLELKFHDDMFDRMIEKILYLTNKQIIDQEWKNQYVELNVIMDFIQQLYEQNNQRFKVIFGAVPLNYKNQGSRVVCFMSLFERLTMMCDISNQGQHNLLEKFNNIQRPYMFYVIGRLLEMFAEILSGPCKFNQIQVANHGYGHFQVLLNKFSQNIDSNYNYMKLGLIQYLKSMSEGFDAQIIQQLILTQELSQLRHIMKSHFAQLVQSFRDSQNSKKYISEYQLSMNDYEQIYNMYQTNTEFRNHIVMKIVINIYSYIFGVSEINLQYNSYINEINSIVSKYNLHETQNLNYSQEELLFIRFMKEIIVEVELVSNDQKVFSFYFERPFKCQFISEQTKQIFLTQKTDYSSQSSKILSLIDNIDDFKTEMEFWAGSSSINLGIKLMQTYNTRKFMNLIIFILCLVSNGIILFYSEKNDKLNRLYKGKYYQIVNLVTFIQIVISIFSYILYLGTKARISFRIEVNRLKKQQRFAKMSIVYRSYLYFKIGVQIVLFKKVRQLLIGLIFPVLGLNVSQMFLGFCLLTFITIGRTNQQILKSVTLHIDHFCSTVVFLVILIYITSLISHLEFQQYFQPLSEVHNPYIVNNVAQNETGCYNLRACFFHLINVGIRDGSGIYSLMENKITYQQQSSEYIWRIIYETTYFLIITVVVISVFTGIIIDTFAELRQKDDELLTMMNDYCYVCHLDRYAFLRLNLNFDQHKSKNHNLWKYVDLYIYLEEKSLQDCSSLEAELKNQIMNNQVQFIPNKLSLQIQTAQQGTSNQQLMNTDFDLKDYNGQLQELCKTVLDQKIIQNYLKQNISPNQQEFQIIDQFNKMMSKQQKKKKNRRDFQEEEQQFQDEQQDEDHQ